MPVFLHGLGSHWFSESVVVNKVGAGVVVVRAIVGTAAVGQLFGRKNPSGQ